MLKTLKSGRALEIPEMPFEVADELKMVVASEMKGTKLDGAQEVDFNFFKDILLVALSSRPIKAALKDCLKRCTYEGRRIDDQTFEPMAAREDYHEVCFEVLQETLRPFLKGLFAGLLENFRKLMPTDLASRP